MLTGMRDGTFLCRPSGCSKEGHTHTLDIVYVIVYLELLGMCYLFSCKGVRHVKVFCIDGRYGITFPCEFDSLLDLVLHFSKCSFKPHNPSLNVILKYPVFS